MQTLGEHHGRPPAPLAGGRAHQHERAPHLRDQGTRRQRDRRQHIIGDHHRSHRSHMNIHIADSAPLRAHTHVCEHAGYRTRVSHAAPCCCARTSTDPPCMLMLAKRPSRPERACHGTMRLGSRNANQPTSQCRDA